MESEVNATSKAAGGAITDAEHATQARSKLRTSKMKATQKHGFILTAYTVFHHTMGYVPSIMYIITILTAISMEFAILQHSLEPSIYHVSRRAMSTAIAFDQGQKLQLRLDQLTSQQLPRKYIETYDECLARGLNHAHHEFLGTPGFQYPDARFQTIDWVTENCGRLHHSPQSLTQAVGTRTFTHMTRISYRARRIAEMVTAFAAEKAKALWSRNAPQSIKTGTSTTRLPNPALRKRTRMPFGFRLLCEHVSPCRIVYAPSIGWGTPLDKVPVPEDAVKKIETMCLQLLSLQYALHKMKCAAAWLAILLIPWQLAGVVYWVLTQPISTDATNPTLYRQHKMYKIPLDLLRGYIREEPRNVVCMVTQAVITFIGLPIATCAPAAHSQTVLHIGLFLLMSSLSAVIFYLPHKVSMLAELRPVAAACFGDLRRIALGQYNKVCRFASHRGKLVATVAVYYNELRRIALEYYHDLSRSVSRYFGFLAYRLNVEDYLKNYRPKKTPSQTYSNNSESETESGGVAISSHEIGPDFNNNGTPPTVDGENGTDDEVVTEFESITFPATDDDDTDTDTDSSDGSDVDGSVTPISDEEEGWSMVDVFDA